MRLRTIVFVTVLATIALLSSPTRAQVGSFGRNKPTTKLYDWQFVQTPHFDIYYHQGMEDVARIATTIAEEAYEQISASYDYRLRNRVPIVIYGSRSGFRETHLTPGLVPEGTGGFTEFLKNRVVVPFEGSYPSFRHVLHHELTHAVLLDMLYGKDILQGIQNSDIPLWFIEGLAEYESIAWTSESDMWMRDAVINDYLNLQGYFAYKGGQSIMYYIAEVYGPEKIAQILHRLRGFGRFGTTMQAVLGVELEEFGTQWEKDLKKVYWPEIVDREEPNDIAEALTDHTKDDSYFNRNPAFSPYGDKIAFFSGRDYYTSIYVMSAIDGKVLWKVVTGEQSGTYEEMHWQRGQITWSPDAKQLAFVAQATEGDRLYIVDARTGKRERTYQPELDGIYTPAWSPDGSRIAFVGLKRGMADLYILDVESGTITQLTHDRFNESNPAWSPDGSMIAFDSDRSPGLRDTSPQLFYQTSDIYLIDVNTGHMRRLTANAQNSTSPTWSPDGKHIAFVSDRNGIFNLYIAEYDDGTGTLEHSVRPLTNILTGAFFPSWSPTGDKIAFSGFNQGGWDIYVIRRPLDKLKDTELTSAFFLQQERISYRSVHRHLSAEEQAAVADTAGSYRIGPRLTSTRSESWDIVHDTMTDPARGGFRTRSYSPKLEIDMVTGYAAYSTLGGVGGELLVSASDLMSHHNLVFTTSLYRDLRDSDYALLYQYLRRRTHYAVYVSQQKTWYPFRDDGNQWGIQSGLVERSELYGGVYASRPTSQYRRFEYGVDALRAETSVLYDQYAMPGYSVASRTRSLNAYLTNIAYVHDNTLWSNVWAVKGSRWRFQLRGAPPYANSQPFGVLTADWRKYMLVGRHSSFAFRFSGGASFAESGNAPVFYLGGLPYWINYRYGDIPASTFSNDVFSTFVFPLRGTDYYEMSGRRYALMNVEYRFPLIYFLAAGFPFQMIFSNVGGVLFLDLAHVWDVPPDHRAYNSTNGPLGGYGYGVRVNLGGFLLRIDVAWKTDMRETMSSARYYWTLGYDF